MIYEYKETQVINMEIEILPCPFCGSENIKPIRVDGDYGYSPSEDYVKCCSCGATGSVIKDDNCRHHAKEAIERWNNRAYEKYEFGDNNSLELLATQFCTVTECKNCPVMIHNYEKRTEREKTLLHEPCATNLYKWILEQAIIKNVYEPGRYKDNIKQLAIDFNNLPEIYRDKNRISALYPDYVFVFSIKTNMIESIII